MIRTIKYILNAAVIASLAVSAHASEDSSQWQKEFDITKCNMQATGKNPYFILEPGYQIVLEGEDTRLHITVLDETRLVDGVITRVVEEKEWEDGELYEISRNYFAICEQSKDAFYFGEDVDFYKNGKVVKHDGTWLAGRDGSKAGLIMPGAPKIKMKYFQEVAPGIAMDRAEIVSLDETCKTPAGTFSNCMKVEESTALNIFEKEYKYYAPGIGLIRDEDLVLTKHGLVSNME